MTKQINFNLVLDNVNELHSTVNQVFSENIGPQSFIITDVNQHLYQNFSKQVVQPLVDAKRFSEVIINTQSEYIDMLPTLEHHTFVYVIETNTLIYCKDYTDFTNRFDMTFKDTIDDFILQLNALSLIGHWTYSYETTNQQALVKLTIKKDNDIIYDYDDYDNTDRLTFDNQNDTLTDVEKIVFFDALFSDNRCLISDSEQKPFYLSVKP